MIATTRAPLATSSAATAARRLARLPLVPAFILCAALLAALLAPLLAPHDPSELNLLGRSLPPAWFASGSTAHFLGTDQLGRDILSRLIWGARISMLVALVCVSGTALMGTLIGVLAGFLGGRVDNLLMRLTDVMLAIPYLLIALVVAGALGASLGNVILIIVVMNWAGLARIVRGEALALRRRDFVALAHVAGVGNVAIMLRHIVPNVLNSVVVVSTLGVGSVILFESTLSFLGVGVPPPTPSWGGMVADGRSYIDSEWWISLFPGLAITAVCLAGNMLGDWLREVLDPKSRRA